MLILASILLAISASSPAPSDATPATDLAPRGEMLLGSLRCTACHAAGRDVEERLASARAPRLDDAGARLSPAWLRSFLAAPHADASGERMPDLIGALPEAERAVAIEELVQFLATQGDEFEAGPIAGAFEDMERGRQLFHSIGCVACHGPQEPLADLGTPYWEFELTAGITPPPAQPDAVSFPDLGTKTSVPALKRFLLAPHTVIADGRMPDLRLAEDEAHAIALYLLREQFLAREDPYDEAPGISYDYYEGDFNVDVADFGQLSPVRSGSADSLDSLPEHRGNGFGFVFHGMLRIDTAGLYTFETTSDDGSRLWIGETLVVQNDGQHPMTTRSGELELEAGSHMIRVHMFENGGGEGLRVRWAGPGIELGAIPGDRLLHRSLSWQSPQASELSPDADAACAGRERFQATLEGRRVLRRNPRGRDERA